MQRMEHVAYKVFSDVVGEFQPVQALHCPTYLAFFRMQTSGTYAPSQQQDLQSGPAVYVMLLHKAGFLGDQRFQAYKPHKAVETAIDHIANLSNSNFPLPEPETTYLAKDSYKGKHANQAPYKGSVYVVQGTPKPDTLNP